MSCAIGPDCSHGTDIVVGYQCQDQLEWDQFVLGHKEPHHEQLTGWASVRAEAGWSASHLAVRNGTQISGCAQILEMTIKRLFRVGYLPRGPLIAGTESREAMVRELTNFARIRRYSYLAVSLPYFAHDLIPHLLAAGFARRPIQMPPAVWARATVIFDLRKTVDELFMDMAATSRNEIRRGIKSGVVVREGSEKDLDLFFHLVTALCNRRGVVSNMPGPAAVRKMWSLFAPLGQLRLFLGDYEGKPLCALMVIVTGKWARAWRIGWDGEQRKLFPTKVLYWQVIQWCRANGCEHFDMVGIDERDARELADGRPRQSPFHCSITQFKVALGGDILMLPGEWCYFPNRISRFLFEFGGNRLMANDRIRKVANRLHQLSSSKTR
jgi:peptidoglycan pentaglycine glycine transferase (the first glycine)